MSLSYAYNIRLNHVLSGGCNNPACDACASFDIWLDDQVDYQMEIGNRNDPKTIRDQIINTLKEENDETTIT